jgi:hypothetical protein
MGSVVRSGAQNSHTPALEPNSQQEQSQRGAIATRRAREGQHSCAQSPKRGRLRSAPELCVTSCLHIQIARPPVASRLQNADPLSVQRLAVQQRTRESAKRTTRSPSARQTAARIPMSANPRRPRMPRPSNDIAFSGRAQPGPLQRGVGHCAVGMPRGNLRSLVPPKSRRLRRQVGSACPRTAVPKESKGRQCLPTTSVRPVCSPPVQRTRSPCPRRAGAEPSLLDRMDHGREQSIGRPTRHRSRCQRSRSRASYSQAAYVVGPCSFRSGGLGSIPSASHPRRSA